MAVNQAIKWRIMFAVNIKKHSMRSNYNVKSNQYYEAILTSGDYSNDLSYLNLVNKTVQDFPYSHKEVLPGVVWGHFDRFYTPAYWKLEYCMTNFSQQYYNHKIGNTIIEEVVACLLGGYGLPAELGLQAFERLRDKELIVHGTSETQIVEALRQPFVSKTGRNVTYRFFNQKSKYIAQFLNRNDLDMTLVQDDLALRSWLLGVKGIGPKTASWITRNWLHSENVAIIDVHILRAGIIAGFFTSHADVKSQYFDLEERYLAFCQALGVLPSCMDSLMWSTMRKSNKIALRVLKSLC